MVKYLVTSANGYIALHVIDQLLNNQSVHVRGVVRSIKDQACIEPLVKLATNKPGKLELIEADLMDSITWSAAVKSIDYIIHFTSPFPLDKLTPQNEGLFEPTVLGTINILNAAVNTSVKRIVINSCCSTVASNEAKNPTAETGWAQERFLILEYANAKLLSEQVVWNFVEERKRKKLPCFEVAVINPAAVLGPVLSSTVGPTATVIINLMNNKHGRLPHSELAVCDVRDVALANIRASFLAEAAGQRHIITSHTGCITVKQLAQILSEEFAPTGLKICTELADDSANLAAKASTVIDDFRMRQVLGIQPIDVRKTLVDSVNSYIQYGIFTPDLINNDTKKSLDEIHQKKKSFSFQYFNKKSIQILNS